MKILWISDFDPVGSGYMNISLNLCYRLAMEGRHELKVIGILQDRNIQNDFPFTFIPSRNIDEALLILKTLFMKYWTFDVLIVALDFPFHSSIARKIQDIRNRLKYIGILPIESSPIGRNVKFALMMMDKSLIISKFGYDLVSELNLTNSDYIPIGIDGEIWKPQEDRQKIRENLFNVHDDACVVLTVADNQERKNLPAGMEAVSKLIKKGVNAYHVLVTREHLPFGWDLREIADWFEMSDRLIIFERGVPMEILVKIYSASDIFFLPSKAEGLGMPTIEAMACRVPVVGTNCTSTKVLIETFGGFPVPYNYVYIDPFGNGNRYLIDSNSAADILFKVWEQKRQGSLEEMLDKAREKVIIHHDWNKSLEVLNRAIDEVTNEK